VDVFYVMRYTPPFADDIMANLSKYDEVFAFPMYPHYSQTTTKSSMEDFMESAKKYGIEGKIKTIDSYYDNELYNKTIVERIKEAMDSVNSHEYDLIFSAHGLTQKVIDKGDLYQKHILANVEAAKKELQKEGIGFNSIHLAYQSRLGPMEWLRPYMSDKLTEFKDKKVLIYPISFTVDNSETECELDIEYRELANEIGIADYKVAKAPNHHPYFMEMIKQKWEES
jgi:ferrochelatase